MSTSCNLSSTISTSDWKFEDDPSSDDAVVKSSSKVDVVRKMPEPMSHTTAQRTRLNMFGVTNTEFTQTAIIHPVLYIAIYFIGDAPSEVDDYHWTFIVGPSHEQADSKGTLYNMRPRLVQRDYRPYGSEWCWLYDQPTVLLRGQSDLLARLMIAEVVDTDILQAIMLRWATRISMYAHVEWMSVRWVQSILGSLDEEDGCLGRRMESFESVEDKGRRLAKTEEKKRKGFCLLDARISTRTLFERERATALLSTATVDLAIKHPVLYVAVYKNNRPRRKNDEYRWAFLIGPSNETAGSEGVRCDVKLHLDSKGRPTWSYNQTIVPLRGEEDVLARLLIADVVNLGPLGKIIRDLDVIPTAERTDSLAGGSEWNSLAWVRERLDMLERNPDCFAYKCQDFSIFERMGRELAEGPNQPWRKGVKQLGVEVPTLIIVRVWKRPDDDETDIGVKLDLAHGETNTISRDIQFVTGVLGAASLERCRRDAEREQGEMKGEQKGEGHVGPKGSEDKDNLTEWTKLQHLNKAKKIAGDVGETEVTARPLGARVTTISFVLPDNHEMASEGEKVAGEDEEGEDETDSEDDEAEEEEEEDSGEEEDDDSDEDESEVEGLAGDNVGEEKANARPEGLRRSITVNFSLSKKPEKETEEKYVAKKMDEDEDEIESEEDEDKDGSESEGIAEENAGDRKVNARPESVRSPTVIFPLSKKPENAKGEGNVAEKDKEDENETESEEDEDEDESEESDGDDENVAEIAEKDEEDGDETESEEDEEEDESEECDGEDDDESDGDNENEEEEEDGKHAGVLTTVNKMPTTTLSGAGESEPDGEKGASS